jgi:predicted NBD/HSP70 family sugar kinase
VNISAFGYFKKEGFLEDDTIAYLYYPLNACPGAGMIINGQIFKGHTNFAGEVSLLPMVNRDANKEQGDTDMDQLTKDVIDTISTLICVINPKGIVLSGLNFSEGILSDIQKSLVSNIPVEHIPVIELKKDFHEYYVYGLTTMALKLLECNIQIREK